MLPYGTLIILFCFVYFDSIRICNKSCFIGVLWSLGNQYNVGTLSLLKTKIFMQVKIIKPDQTDPNGAV